MRMEARKIYDELNRGTEKKKIKGSKTTKNRVYKIFMYKRIIGELLDDIIQDRYRLSYHELENWQKRLKRKI